MTVRVPYVPAERGCGTKLTLSRMSMSRGGGRVPAVVICVSSMTEAMAAEATGVSLVPLMVTVRVLDAVPPCPSLTV